jgi:DUF1016 N-terminal domain/KilA-N domain
MIFKSTDNSPHTGLQEEMPELISRLRGLIESARGQALRAVDSIQVRTCWEIGRHIMEFEQQGQDRATYGARLIPKLAEFLTAEFGKGFDERNLRHMRSFFQGFSIWNAVRTELSWTHYRNLLRVENQQARNWYMEEAANQKWSTRALDRQISTLYYERLLASSDKDPVRQEATMQIATLQKTPREFVRDPVLLEFLGLPETRVRNPDEPQDVVKNWLRNRSTVEYLGLWEKINNADFKGVEFDSFRLQAGSSSFTFSPNKWIEATGAIGIKNTAGRCGTYAHCYIGKGLLE